MPSEQEQQPSRKSRKPKRSLWKKLIFSTIIIFLLIIIVSSIMVADVIREAPKLKASDLQTPQATRIYDQDDDLVDTLFQEENRIKVDIDNIPKKVQKAVTSIEDKRYQEHHGVDFQRIFKAVVSNVKNGWGEEGGSTITQQVIKRSVLSTEKTLKRKIQEAWLAWELENQYSKDQILELYLNNVYFGNGAYGIQTAAKTYFDEDDLSKLSNSQAALLAGLPNSPSADDPFESPEQAEKRRNTVLTAMENNHAISNEEAKEAKDKDISEILKKGDEKQDNNDFSDAFVDTVYEQLVEQEEVVSKKEFYQGGLKIHTTLDSEAQQKVYDLLQSEDISYPDKHFETGISLVDTETGAVEAVGGGRNFKSIGYKNYGSQPQNQSPGSTVKPILDYGPVIEHRKWPTSHTLNDEEYQYSDGTPMKEWDNEYWGDISIRRALEWSRNIPAFKAFQEVGKDKAQAFAKDLGIDIDPIYESAAIGGFEDVSPLQMAEAYAAFGNGGTYHEPFTVNKIEFPNGEEWEPEKDSHKAMEDYTAYMITDMLKTVVESGTGTQANIENLPVAGKTGSTNISEEDMNKYGIFGGGLRDSWFSGYTPQHSLSIWTGYPSFKNEEGEIQYIREDGTEDIPQQIFKQLMTEVSDTDIDDFEKPDSVASMNSELYIRGAHPKSEEQENEESESEQGEGTSEQENGEDEEPVSEQEENSTDEEPETESEDNQGENDKGHDS